MTTPGSERPSRGATRPGTGPEGPRIDSSEIAVSPEEAPRPSGTEVRAVEHYFGDRAELAQRYVGHLVSSGIERGLLGPREIPRVWSRHVLNCAAVTEGIPQGALVADVGSGAGLPGLVIALARPDVFVILIEPLERRAAWLQEVIEDLGIGDRVDVVRARAEDVVGDIDADVVTARAVSALRTLVPLTAPLVHGDGLILAIKGRSAQDEVNKAQKVLKKHKVRRLDVESMGTDVLEEPTTVVALRILSR